LISIYRPISLENRYFPLTKSQRMCQTLFKAGHSEFESVRASEIQWKFTKFQSLKKFSGSLLNGIKAVSIVRFLDLKFSWGTRIIEVMQPARHECTACCLCLKNQVALRIAAFDSICHKGTSSPELPAEHFLPSVCVTCLGPGLEKPSWHVEGKFA